ncbi:MAG: hypothetical protein IJV31_00760 [Clostridia bacterium]|nr:hypothetical protein [Clostridia bacterium]
MIVGYLMKPQGLQGEFKQCMCSNRGGYKLNTVDIKALKISNLNNTSTIQVINQRATVTCSSNTDNCEFAVYCEGAGYAKGGEVIATGGEGTTVEITLQSGLYKVWVEATNPYNEKATQYFITSKE